MGLGSDRFHVGWACPFCTRNTLRSFDAAALTFTEKPATTTVPPGSRPAPRSTAPGH
jgi:hypothetical protein